VRAASLVLAALVAGAGGMIVWCILVFIGNFFGGSDGYLA
jgi:hypothetical protein